MIVPTTQFGEIELSEEQIITFSSGIPGFRERTRFTVIEVEDSPFVYIQSVEQANLAFVAVSPFDFYQGYEFKIEDPVIHDLQLENEKDVQVWTIVTVRGDLANATVNLAAPILINKRNGQAVQYILPSAAYGVRHPLFPVQAVELLSEGGA